MKLFRDRISFNETPLADRYICIFMIYCMLRESHLRFVAHLKKFSGGGAMVVCTLLAIILQLLSDTAI